MKRNLAQITVFLLCVTFLLIGCSQQSNATGVLEEGGVHSPDGILDDSSQGATVIENSGLLVTKTYDFKNFNMVEARAFDLSIQQGDEYAVAVEVEQNALEHVRVAVEDGRLKLGLDPDQTYSMVNIPLRAQITMPELREITLDLGSESTATGFDCKDALRKDLTLGSSLTCGSGGDQLRFEAEF